MLLACLHVGAEAVFSFFPRGSQRGGGSFTALLRDSLSEVRRGGFVIWKLCRFYKSWINSWSYLQDVCSAFHHPGAYCFCWTLPSLPPSPSLKEMSLEAMHTTVFLFRCSILTTHEPFLTNRNRSPRKQFFSWGGFAAEVREEVSKVSEGRARSRETVSYSAAGSDSRGLWDGNKEVVAYKKSNGSVRKMCWNLELANTKHWYGSGSGQEGRGCHPYRYAPNTSFPPPMCRFPCCIILYLKTSNLVIMRFRRARHNRIHSATRPEPALWEKAGIWFPIV